MIVSYSEGRVRLRFKELQDKTVAGLVEKYLGGIEGIEAVEIKPVTGSILIQYNPAVLPTAALVEQGRAALAQFGLNLEVPADVLTIIN